MNGYKEMKGKAKIAFDKWYNSNESLYMYAFHLLPKSMQCGVKMEFYNTTQYMGKPLFDTCFEAYFKVKVDYMDTTDVVEQALDKSEEIFNRDL